MIASGNEMRADEDARRRGKSPPKRSVSRLALKKLAERARAKKRSARGGR